MPIALLPSIRGLLRRGARHAASAAALLALAVAGSAADAPRYRFAVGDVRAYTWTQTQTVAWSSAGDDLQYESQVVMRLALHAVEATPEQAVLHAAITRVTASLRGEGVSERIDSAETATRSSPLLGHLTVLEGVVLRLTVDPATGTVAAVTGGEEIARRLAERTRSAIGDGAPSPVAQQAATAYAPERLARMWTQLLALPRTQPETFALDGAVSGSIERRWKDGAWSLHLPAGSDSLAVTLAPAPTPAGGPLSKLSGTGGLTLLDGWPARSHGNAAFTLDLVAQTQPVRQQHRLTWELAPTPPAGR